MNAKTFARLTADLSSDDFAKVEDAANTLCALRDANAYPLILESLECGTPIVQRVMLWALRNYELSDYAQFMPYVASADDDVREAAQVLFMEGGDLACRALVSSLSSDNLELQYAAVETLGQMRSECAKKPLLTSLSASASEVRELAAYSLSRFEGDDVTDALLSCLSDESAVCIAALSGLRGRVLSSDALLSVMPLLSNADALVRASAVYVLDAAVPDSVSCDSDARVRRAAAEVTDSASILRQLLLDADSSVRTAAADAAGKRGMRMDEVLIPMLKDEMPGVRRAAAAALSNADGDVVISALVSALSDPKPGIRAAAANSLGKIGGEKAKAALVEASRVKNPILAGIIKNALSELEKRERGE